MRRLVFLVAMLAGLPALAAAQACQEIRFAPGATGAQISGVTPGDITNGMVCYRIEVGEGQTAHVTVKGGNGTAFNVPGVTDNQDDLSWTTRAGVYEIHVYQTFRSVRAEPFVLRVSVTD